MVQGRLPCGSHWTPMKLKKYPCRIHQKEYAHISYYIYIYISYNIYAKKPANIERTQSCLILFAILVCNSLHVQYVQFWRPAPWSLRWRPSLHRLGPCDWPPRTEAGAGCCGVARRGCLAETELNKGKLQTKYRSHIAQSVEKNLEREIAICEVCISLRTPILSKRSDFHVCLRCWRTLCCIQYFLNQLDQSSGKAWFTFLAKEPYDR